MSSRNFAFLTKASFLGVTENQSACAYAVAGIAYDGATTNRPGARFGPHAIRRASHMLCGGVFCLDLFVWADCSTPKMNPQDYQIVAQGQPLIPAKAGIHVDVKRPNGFPLSRE